MVISRMSLNQPVVMVITVMSFNQPVVMVSFNQPLKPNIEAKCPHLWTIKIIIIIIP